MPQTLRDIKELLAGAGLNPKKRLGQNFLHDGNQMRRIVDAAAIAPGERVLEVGAGTGALSERVLEAGAQLVAVEIDRDLEPILRYRLAAYGPRVRLLFADVLHSKHQLNPRVAEALGRQPFKLVANLPYQIASPLLVNLAAEPAGMSLAVVTIQLEVAERLAAAPGGKDYGPLSVMVQAMCTVEHLAKVRPSCFWPQPQVESAVVRLSQRDHPLTADPTSLSRLLHKLFSRRRKQLGTILGRHGVLPACLDPTARPETLTVAQIVDLARRLS